MACGTGKTFTALRIAEQQTTLGETILFLAPSITLVSQSIREWCNQAADPMQIHVVCSDTKAGRVGDEDTSDTERFDLVAPATTNACVLLENLKRSRRFDRRTVIFSTYHSLDVISKCQDLGMGPIALVICDEAHRTTGVTLPGQDESSFVGVHDSQRIKADKRLYMTATPRIYGGQSQQKAQAARAALTSMDDEQTYGPEFYRFTFAEAVEADQLCDYRVLVFGIEESVISRELQQVLGDGELDLSLNDAGKIVASWNAISKQKSPYEQFEQDPDPMRSVVAFARGIKGSQAFRDSFNEIIRSYHGASDGRKYEADHIDGRDNALKRAERLAWLGEGGNECHVLSNAKCLTEGVDVPALDAVLFLSPRRSQIDVVQAVGRAMRRSPGKKFGYIIIPITVPASENYEKIVLDGTFNPTFQVLQALKSHDEDFYDTINQADLKENKKVSVAIFTGGEDSGNGTDGATDSDQGPGQPGLELEVSGVVREAIYARIVDSLTDKHYYSRWAKETAQINDRYAERITGLLTTNRDDVRSQFAKFHSALRRELNDGITEAKAVSLLAQHLVTRPIFDALFSEFDFANHNPVSVAMEDMVQTLRFDHGTDSETKELAGFYTSVRRRVMYVDTAEKKQRIIADLYQEFFKAAFPMDSEALGIVYTPVEAVDFIIRSVEDVLNEDFGASLGDSGVDVLDPFVGTGTFISRLLASGIIQPADLVRMYAQELHANEINLLAYYIASINIEMTFQEMARSVEYAPFEGIVFADSFEAQENRIAPRFGAGFFEANSDRMRHQNERDIRVIIGNPPWSTGQRAQNDDNQNRHYPGLRARISQTYVSESIATLRRNLYDTYVHAVRMASDRIQESKRGGIVAFVTNGGFIDSGSFDGFRKTLVNEFHQVYCLDLRGDQRTSGDKSRREGGKLFGGGSRARVAILIMVKFAGGVNAQGRLFYHDVGDYLSREQKLQFLARHRKASVPWTEIAPDEHGDWINLRVPGYDAMVPLYGEGGAVFKLNSLGLSTNRDPWVYGFSSKKVIESTQQMIDAFNRQIPTSNPVRNPREFSWTRKTLRMARDGIRLEHDGSRIVTSAYRPFTKQIVYFDRSVNEEVSRLESIFPTPDKSNIGIAVNARDKNRAFSCLMLDALPNLHTIGDTQFLPRWTYDKPLSGDGLEKVSNINQRALKTFQTRLGERNVTADDLFYYVYGVLHHPSYRTTYAANLSREAPRIPVATSIAGFRAFVRAGVELSNLHVNYEFAEPYPVKEEIDLRRDDLSTYCVTKKMKHPGKRGEQDTSVLVFNNHIKLSGIPDRAYRYVLGQYSAVRWLMERYYVQTDPASGIENDPNAWGAALNNPRYVLDLIKSVITVSVKTVDIMDSLPELPAP